MSKSITLDSLTRQGTRRSLAGARSSPLTAPLTIGPNMQEPTQHLRALARRIVDEALKRLPVRAALLTGSAARGNADFYSDLDLLFYVDEIPPEELVAGIRDAVGGTSPTRKDEPTDYFCREEFDLQGVRTEVSFVALAWADSRLDALLTEIDEFDSPFQKSSQACSRDCRCTGRTSSSAGEHACATTRSRCGE